MGYFSTVLDVNFQFSRVRMLDRRNAEFSADMTFSEIMCSRVALLSAHIVDEMVGERFIPGSIKVVSFGSGTGFLGLELGVSHMEDMPNIAFVVRDVLLENDPFFLIDPGEFASNVAASLIRSNFGLSQESAWELLTGGAMVEPVEKTIGVSVSRSMFVE